MAVQLAVNDVSLHFGGINVLDRISMNVEPGQVVGLVGPNGAGKTSLFNCISGHYQPSSGSISIDGVETLRTPAWRMSRLGLARTFQHPALRLDATVLENVMLGAHSWLPGGAASWSLGLPKTRARERQARGEALDLLERTGLSWAAQEHAGELSHGLHKGVELCRALLARPQLLLLDEPAAGLSHAEVERFIETIRQVRADYDLTVVIVEHHMGLISALADQVVVLDHGAKLMEGTATEAQSDPRVVEAYLGKEVTDDELLGA
ncbi:ABC transporter ATP-binding protein [Cryobacterium sp. Hh7]|uniref:ABC transporter ATP-binding protein n=1 Tax=Cryobacterium sp. Hh7 TaxID=1259159 RepID=UPI0018E07A0C|nr:ABC transporter ATP-binding protein [Cryobacterium sp. Hh7]